MKNATTFVGIMLLAFALTGCGEPQQGPAEQAGKQIDQAAEKMREHVSEAAEKGGDKLEGAGDKLRESTN